MFCGVYVIEGIKLQFLTENVIKGRPVVLFCNISNFTNVAEFNMPNGLPFQKLFCNNRDGCSIDKHKLFALKSNSSGLFLTLKNVTETIEGKYECIYKGRKATYLLDIASIDVIDPKNGCKILWSQNGYKCQTNCLVLKKEKMVHWEFITVNKVLTWTTSARSSNHSCRNKKVQYDSHMTKDNIGYLNGTLRCYVTLSEGLNITSPSIPVLMSAKEYKQATTISFVALTVMVILVVAIMLMVLTIITITRRNKSKIPTNKKKNEEQQCTFESLLQKQANKDDEFQIMICDS